MHLVTRLVLVLVGFTSVAVASPAQFAFSSQEGLMGLPDSIAAPLSLELARLPLDHLAQLQHHLARYTEPRTLELAPGTTPTRVILTEGAKALLSLARVRFIDVTLDPPELSIAPRPPRVEYPRSLRHTVADLAPLFDQIDLDQIAHFLANFTAFHSRYYRSQSGRDSQRYLLQHLDDLHQTLDPHANLTYREFDHGWAQKTVIVRWDPLDRDRATDYDDNDVVILSAHQDSTNSLPFLPAPGADDDASGTVTLVQTLTRLLAHKFSPRSRPVEFHFYSAEEGGLLGSNEVAREYKAHGKRVKAMFHMDVVAYVKPGTEPVIGMITDGTDSRLVEFMKLVVDEFATIPYAETQCGYGCSDFASFTKYGFPSTCLAEGKFADSNPNMHSTEDTVDAVGYSLEHIREFVRVAIGYAVELGGMKPSPRKANKGGKRSDAR